MTLTKSIFVQLGLTGEPSATHAAIKNKTHGPESIKNVRLEFQIKRWKISLK